MSRVGVVLFRLSLSCEHSCSLPDFRIRATRGFQRGQAGAAGAASGSVAQFVTAGRIC
jgi:hypothetical protein